jgi:alpha-glucosidase
MKSILKSLLFLLAVTVQPILAQKKITLKSPDGKIVFSFRLTDASPVYQVSYKNKVIVGESNLGLTFRNAQPFGPGLKISTPVFKSVDETYELPVGKTSKVISHSRQVLIPLSETTLDGRLINLVVRVFDDGLAFRYEFPRQKKLVGIHNDR